MNIVPGSQTRLPLHCRKAGLFNRGTWFWACIVLMSAFMASA